MSHISKSNLNIGSARNFAGNHPRLKDDDGGPGLMDAIRTWHQDITMPLVQQLTSMVPAAAGLGFAPLVNNLMGGGMSGGATGVGGGDAMFNQQMELLNMQRQIQYETQLFSTLTNIEKARHDAKMAAVRNIRP